MPQLHLKISIILQLKFKKDISLVVKCSLSSLYIKKNDCAESEKFNFRKNEVNDRLRVRGQEKTEILRVEGEKRLEVTQGNEDERRYIARINEMV